MTTKQKTIIVTGASQGIGAAVANVFLDRGYNVVGNSRKISHKNELQRSDKLALVDGDIGLASTAEMIVGTAVKRFGSVDALVDALRAALSAAPAQLDLLGRQGAARVSELHDSVNESRKLSALFRSVVAL